jgi:4a-hydroxytetrahydrobiopterin dehydratase
MPFWKALLGYDYRPDSASEDLVDPQRRGPAFWFEEVREPHGVRNGIHVAVWVPAEDAEARVAAALAAGGRLVSGEDAPKSWLLADAMGNEADVASIKGRD